MVNESVVKEMEERLKAVEEIISLTRHGSIHLRKIGAHSYYYLVYRKDGVPVNEYLGPEKTFDIKELEVELDLSRRLKEERKNIKAKLKK